MNTVTGSTKHKAYLNELSLKYRRRVLKDIEGYLIDGLRKEKTFAEIAELTNYSDSHLQTLAKELLGLVHQETHIMVNKGNFNSVLNSILEKFPDNEFNACHGLNPKPSVDRFCKDEIVVNVGTFWKYDAINKLLILKAEYPVVVDLAGLSLANLGQEILLIATRIQSPYALQELCTILAKYLE